MPDQLDQVLDEPPAVSAPPIKRLAPKPLKPKRRPPLSQGELTTIRELASRGATSREIAGKLDDCPVRAVREAMRRMGFVTVAPPPPVEPPPVEPVLASSAATKSKRSKARHPFSVGERAAIERLARNGVAPNEIAKTINRGNNYPQVVLYVRRLGLASPAWVPVVIGDSKGSCSQKTWAALAAAAKRRSVRPALLAVQIIDGVLRRGSVDAVTNTDAELVDELRTVQVVLNLEAVDRANGACRDYRLRGVALAHRERPG